MNKLISIFILPSLIIATLLFGCSNNDNEVFVPEGAGDYVSAAKNDLTQRFQIPLADIELHSLKEVEWFDTSLGCPEPGFEYAQVITPGFEIILKYEGSMYLYGTDKNNNVQYCGVITRDEIRERHQKASYQDGWPNQPIFGGYVIIRSPEN